VIGLTKDVLIVQGGGDSAPDMYGAVSLENLFVALRHQHLSRVAKNLVAGASAAIDRMN
jgi:hypothetical protein